MSSSLIWSSLQAASPLAAGCHPDSVRELGGLQPFTVPALASFIWVQMGLSIVSYPQTIFGLAVAWSVVAKPTGLALLASDPKLTLNEGLTPTETIRPLLYQYHGDNSVQTPIDLSSPNLNDHIPEPYSKIDFTAVVCARHWIDKWLSRHHHRCPKLANASRVFLPMYNHQVRYNYPGN